jgi:hypothetical protein
VQIFLIKVQFEGWVVLIVACEIDAPYAIRIQLKGTGSPNGLGFSWHIWIYPGLKKGRGWFLNFLGIPSIIHLNTRISCGKCDCELA